MIDDQEFFEKVQRTIMAAGLIPSSDTVNCLFTALAITNGECYGLTNDQMGRWVDLVSNTSATFIKGCQEVNSNRN